MFGGGYKIRNQNVVHFVSFTVVVNIRNGPSQSWRQDKKPKECYNGDIFNFKKNKK